jgi:hypothetical protein
MNNRQDVIVVWDSEARYFQSCPSTYRGDGIAHGKQVAQQIKGSYKVVSAPGFWATVEVDPTATLDPVFVSKR